MFKYCFSETSIKTDCVKNFEIKLLSEYYCDNVSLE